MGFVMNYWDTMDTKRFINWAQVGRSLSKELESSHVNSVPVIDYDRRKARRGIVGRIRLRNPSTFLLPSFLLLLSSFYPLKFVWVPEYHQWPVCLTMELRKLANGFKVRQEHPELELHQGGNRWVKMFSKIWDCFLKSYDEWFTYSASICNRTHQTIREKSFHFLRDLISVSTEK